MDLKYIIVIYITIVNIFTFMVYAIDKRLATKGKRRISEKTLIVYCFAGGSLGAITAMVACHHKISKKKFYVWVPIIIVVQYSLIAYFVLKYLTL